MQSPIVAPQAEPSDAPAPPAAPPSGPLRPESRDPDPGLDPGTIAGSHGGPVLVIGHRNPDTDAICSAIGYADFLRRTRLPEAVAACCGEINERTAWVLGRAGVPAPRLVMDVRPTAATIARRDVVTASDTETFLDVYHRLSRRGYRSLPVVDGERRVLGVPTFLELLQLLLPNGEMHHEARRVEVSLANVARCLSGELVVAPPATPGGNGNGSGGAAGEDEEEELVLVVGASTVGTIRERMGRFPAEQVMVIVGDRPRVHRLAIDSGARCLVLTGGFRLAPDLEEEARRRGVCVITCKHDTATTAQLVRCSRRIRGALSKDFHAFGAHARVGEILQKVQHAGQPLFPVTDEETGKLVGVFSKSDLVDPPRARLVLVDHNEFSQAVAGADEAEVLEVVDHHRLSGNLISREPIRFVNEPVGSTSTIVARFFRDGGLEPEPAIATCLAAGLISDTLNLTSPTTTPVDREILPWLAELAGIDIEGFTRDFFAAGSMLRSLPPADAIRADRKEFDEGGWRLSISQIEELGLDEFWRQEEDLESALGELCREHDVHFACLMVTDITKHVSILVTTGESSVVDAIEYPEIRRNLHEMRGVVSRKKQLFPYLGRLLARLGPPE